MYATAEIRLRHRAGGTAEGTAAEREIDTARSRQQESEKREGRRTANATVGAVRAPARLGRLVDLDVHNLERVHVQLLELRRESVRRRKRTESARR
jgi:hypothetical protein